MPEIKDSPPPKDNVLAALPQYLAGFLATLPEAAKGWDKTKRDLFVKTFEGLLDLCYPIK